MRPQAQMARLHPPSGPSPDRPPLDPSHPVQITKDAVVTIDYTLTDDDGQVLDTSEGRGPLPYMHGRGGIIPGLEAELEGKTEGDAFQVQVPPEKGYGMRNEQNVQLVPRAQMPEGMDPQIGQQLQVQGPNGKFLVTVTEVLETEVRLDANHPLAGVRLNFDVTVRGVREATAEELEHGHVHGPGGAHE